MCASYYGRHVTAHDTDYGACTPGNTNERATVFPAMTEDGWATKVGIWGGRSTGSNVTLSLAVWNLSNGATGAPDTLRARTASFSVSTSMVDQFGGASYEANLTSSLKLHNGYQYGVGFLATGAAFDHAQNADGTAMYFGNVASQPPGTFPAGNASIEGKIDVWVVYTPNTAPATPSVLAPSGNITTLTPTFNADFTDAEAAIGDFFLKYRIQLRQVGTTTLLWDQTYDANSTEQTAKQMQRAYGGSALSAAVNYEWRVMVWDQFAWASAWSNWTSFTVNGGGTITLATGATPTGKQLAINGYTFGAGQWSHPNSLAMASLTVELWQNGALSQTKTIAKSVASSASPGTSFTTTFAAMGFSDLTFGQSYQWRMQGIDTNGVTSQFTAFTSFTTDAYPSTPTGLTPNNNKAITSLPKLQATVSDSDDTPTALGGNLTATAYIYGQQTLLNPTFASDATGWTGSNTGDTAGATATLARDTAVFASGAGKIAITASTAVAGLVYHAEYTAAWIPAVPGESYTVRGTVQTDTANLHPLLQLRFYDASRTLLSAATETDWSPATGTAYSRAFTASAPANAVYVRLGFAVRAAASNVTGNCYGDAFSYDAATRAKVSMTYNSGNSLYEYQTVAGTDDVDTVSFGGTVTGGNWTFSFNGATTGNLAYNISAASLQTTLQALPTIGSGNVTVTGGPGPASYVITYTGALRGTYQNPSTVANVNLTGTAPTVSVAQTTAGVSAGVSVYGSFSWTCAGNDGTLQGPSAAPVAFQYLQGPVVTVTSPANGATITTSVPTVAWTATGQVKYQVVITRDSDQATIYDTGVVTSAVQSIIVPAGLLHNATTYDVQVFVTDATPLTGSNAPNIFTLTYSAPPQLSMTASTITLDQDMEDSGIAVAWNPSAQAPNTFAYYIVDRRASGSDPSTATILQYVTNINQTSWIDCFPESGTAYTYSLRQVVTSGTDVIESARAEDDATASFGTIVVCDAQDGQANRAVLRFATAKDETHNDDIQIMPMWGSEKPTALVGVTDYVAASGTFELVTDNQQSALNMLTALRTLKKNKRTVCWRDERGRKYWGILTKFKVNDGEVGTYSVDLELTETGFVEGQSQ